MTEDDVRTLLRDAPVVESDDVTTWGNPHAVAAIAVWPPTDAEPWRAVIFKQRGARDDGIVAFRGWIAPYLSRFVLFADLDLGDGTTWQQLPDGMWFAVGGAYYPEVPLTPIFPPTEPAQDPDWQAAASIPVAESIELDVLTRQQAGQIVIHPGPDGQLSVWAAYRRGLSPEAVEEFRRFVVERVYAFLKNGPQETLWFKRQSDDGWQVTMTVRSG